MNVTRLIICSTVFILAGCTPSYTLVGPGSVPVSKKAISVTPHSAWNRIPPQPNATKWQESWTQNGPLLDVITFVGGLPSGAALSKQKEKDDRKVPEFNPQMTPDDLVSMIEASYRVGGVNLFELTSVEPVIFLGSDGIKLDYSFVADDSLKRRGRCVLSVVQDKLYLIKLEGATNHYFDTALPEFNAMLDSAALR